MGASCFTSSSSPAASLEVPATVDELQRQLAALTTRVTVLEAALSRRRGPRDDDDRRVFAAVANAFEIRSFVGREVIERSQFDATLARALAQADCESPRSLGRLFGRVEGTEIGGLRLTRVAVNKAAGIVWRFEVSGVCVIP
jgi:hypothetical protein